MKSNLFVLYFCLFGLGGTGCLQRAEPASANPSEAHMKKPAVQAPYVSPSVQKPAGINSKQVAAGGLGLLGTIALGGGIACRIFVPNQNKKLKQQTTQKGFDGELNRQKNFMGAKKQCLNAAKKLGKWPRPKTFNTSRRGADGYTPLHRAVMNKDLKELDALLKTEGIDVNIKDNDEWTPLYLAVSEKNLDALNALLKVEGIDVNAKNKRLQTPLHLAVLERNLDALNALLEVEGIDVNTQNTNGNTPLHSAMSRDIKMVEALLKKGAKQDIKNKYHQITLDLAKKQENHQALIDLLAKYKSN